MRALRLICGLGLAAAAPAAAQVPGVPVMNGGFPRGITVAAMGGFGNPAAGDGEAVAVGGTIGFRRVALHGVASRLSGSAFSSEAVHSVGGGATVKLLGGPLVPLSVSLQAGAAFTNHGTGPGGIVLDPEPKRWHVPVGLGITWTIPRPVVALRPWLAPRLDHQRETLADPLADPVPGQPIPTVTLTRTDFGLSGGISFGFLNGLSIDLAVDRVFRDGPEPTIIGLGLSFNLK